MGFVGGDAGPEAQVLQLNEWVGFGVGEGEFILCGGPLVLVDELVGVHQVVGGENGRCIFQCIGILVGGGEVVEFKAHGEPFFCPI